MIRIEIPRRNFLLYLILPHPMKVALMTPGARTTLERINRLGNEQRFSGEAATQYDARHRYLEAEQHDYPVRMLLETWGRRGFGRALDLGAGSGYFTSIIARRATSVIAVEPVPDLQDVLTARCADDGCSNVEVVGQGAVEALAAMPSRSVDSAFVLQTFHHLDGRPRVARELGRVLQPGGRLFLVEPHHNVRRVVRLVREYLRSYHKREFWSDELNWSTHDFLTRGEIRALCRRGGFERPRLQTFWIPYARRLVPDPRRRFAFERAVARVPGMRHFASILAAETVRTERDVS